MLVEEPQVGFRPNEVVKKGIVLSEAGISYALDESGLASEPCMIIARENARGYSYGVLLQHKFRGTELHNFLSALIDNPASKISTVSDWSLPKLARRPTEGKRHEHYKELHRKHQIDPYIGKEYIEFDRDHSVEWMGQLMAKDGDGGEGIFPFLAWRKLASGERSFLSQREAKVLIEELGVKKADVFLGRVWGVYSSNENIRTNVAQTMDLLLGNHSQIMRPAQLGVVVSIPVVPQYEGEGEEKHVVGERPGPAKLLLEEPDGILHKFEAYAAKLAA